MDLNYNNNIPMIKLILFVNNSLKKMNIKINLGNNCSVTLVCQFDFLDYTSMYLNVLIFFINVVTK